MQLRYQMTAPRGLGIRYMPAGNIVEPDRNDKLTAIYFDVDRLRRLGCVLDDPQPEAFQRTDPAWVAPVPVVTQVGQQAADPAAAKTTRLKSEQRDKAKSGRRKAAIG